MDKILVTISGLGLIVFIYWFFFGKKDEQSYSQSVSNGEVDIVVDGGYKPSVIKVKKGEETTLTILRKDSNSCLEEIILPDFKISKYLPLGKEVEIKITPQKEGEYPFHCGMNMFHGKIVVSE
jgi:plastocyanin domain-containing protein